jgi:hypothetical protein
MAVESRCNGLFSEIYPRQRISFLPSQPDDSVKTVNVHYRLSGNSPRSITGVDEMFCRQHSKASATSVEAEPPLSYPILLPALQLRLSSPLLLVHGHCNRARIGD